MNLFIYLHSIATDISPGGLPRANADSSNITSLLNYAFAIIGGLAVIMIVVSGLRYILSSGDPQRMSKAKNGVIYALVGLVVAITAEAIVSFIGGQI
ncbi:MAG TPA: pilin [Candidatus Saccharimonadales bacterium]|nr:pilin [Candidatus Saccharimonadales bacterium]